MKIGDTFRFGVPNGSYGIIVDENHFGGFYVRYNYGLDVKGEPITASANLRADKMAPCPAEMYRRYTSCRAWSPEQREIDKEFNWS